MSASPARAARRRWPSAPAASIFAAQDGYHPDPEGRLHAFCHALPDRWHVMGVILSAAGALSWFDEAVGHGDGIPALLEEAARGSRGSRG